MTKNNYTNRKYHITPYDPNWATTFNVESHKIKSMFGNDAVAIEHIGSTSVPGMTGKPTIDILILVKRLDDADKHIKSMREYGLEFLKGYVMENSYLFRKMNGEALLMNVHVFPENHPHVKEMISLRDYLRSHPEEVKNYSAKKEELHSKYPDSYGDYRKYKDEYMKSLMVRVLSAKH